jgi:hypothetical protein
MGEVKTIKINLEELARQYGIRLLYDARIEIDPFTDGLMLILEEDKPL